MKAVEISAIQAFDDEDKFINEEDEEFESLVGNRNGLSIIENKRQEGSESKNNARKLLVTLIVIACCVLIASKLRSSKNDELIKSPSNDHLSSRPLIGNGTTTNTTPIEIQMEQSNSTVDNDEVAKPSEEENKAEIDLSSSEANSSDGKIEVENSARENETNLTESEVAVVAVEDEKLVENEKSSNEVESPQRSEDESPEIYALKGFRKPEPKLSNKYIPRGLPMSEDERKKLEEKWGAWKLEAPPIVEDLDPSSYPNGDVPREAFSQNAWQTNPEYLKDWLPESIALTERAMEAILAEYGNGPDDIPNKSFEERSFMFSVSILEKRDSWKKPPFNYNNPPGNAGFATQATLDAIKKRLLHSIMLEDSFIVVMGGHSAAAGHGNHFQQSYTLQIQAILEPVLARLGVYHQSHNFGMGGLGTSQNSLAAGNIYGKHIDVLIWDSGMTERDNPSKDLFVRQAVLSGEKIPVIWGEPNSEYQAKVPELGAVLTSGGGSSAGLPWTSDAEQVKSVPWAARYLQCTSEARQLCKDSTYDGVCWLPRDDGVYPEGQKWYPGGRASWHPGNRYHQLAGRVIAFNILLQLHTGLMEWSKTPDYALPDELWHLTDEFERMREAVVNTTSSACFGSLFPEGACTIPLKGRTEFTPRYNPVETSIRSIVMEGVKITDPNPNLYDPPDVRLTVLDPPEGQVNVLRIIENGLPYAPNKARQLALEGKTPPARKMRRLVKSKTDLPPGQGWGLDTKSAPDNCDGSWDSFCGRETKNDCILAGHNDHRGGLMFDSYSGWLKLNLENVTYGLIFARIEDWTGAWMNPGTAGFKCENNYNCENANRQLESGERRHLGNNCDSFVFEFAIDGKVTSWDKTAWDANRKQPQRVVHLWTFLDDRSYTANKDDKNVELAIRLTGCGQETTFTLTHVYWA